MDAAMLTILRLVLGAGLLVFCLLLLGSMRRHGGLS